MDESVQAIGSYNRARFQGSLPYIDVIAVFLLAFLGFLVLDDLLAPTAREKFKH